MSWQLVLWIYIALLVVGGVMGFLKAGSKVSLITSLGFAVPLVAVALGALSLIVAKVILGLVAVVMVVRVVKTKKFMPPGMIAVLSLGALAAVHFLSRGA